MKVYFVLALLFWPIVSVESTREGCIGQATRGHFDSPAVLHDLYGDQFDAKSTDGQGGVVVLGQHNCTALFVGFLSTLVVCKSSCLPCCDVNVLLPR